MSENDIMGGECDNFDYIAGMMKITILALESSVIQSIADPQYCFSAVNMFFTKSGKPAPFDIKIAGIKKEIQLNGGLYTVHPDVRLPEVDTTSLVIIPALFGDLQNAVEINKKAIPEILRLYNEGAEVASLCVGAFMLAATGLVNGKQCSTHWNFCNDFRSFYPEVDLRDGQIITEEKRIYSSGGATSYWNLLLHLVEKYTNREMAVLTAKYFAIDIERNSQSAFTIFRGQKQHNDESIKKAQEYIEMNVVDKITVDELAEKVKIGRRSFERRFKSVTNNTVLEYIQRVRIEAAKRQFEASIKSVNEVMFDVGYNDSKAFRTVFKRITGLTPVEYRNKYNKLTLHS